MDWTTISIAVASFGVIVFFIGFHWGGKAAYTIGMNDGIRAAQEAVINQIEKVYKNEIDKIDAASPSPALDPLNYNLSNNEIDYIKANIASLEKMAEEMAKNPEDVGLKNVQSQIKSLQKVLEDDAAQKASKRKVQSNLENV